MAIIHGTNAADILHGTPGADWIDGKRGDDRIDGRGGDDHIRGGAGNDSLRGGTGNDIVHGNAGNDRLYGHSGTDLLTGGSGGDRIDAGAGDDFALGGEGDDHIWGGDGTDRLFGGAGSDTIHAGRGSNQLFGDAGNDVLVMDYTVIGGGPGRNVDEYRDSYFDGGAGSDTLRIDAPSDFGVAGGVTVDSSAGTIARGFPYEDEPIWPGGRFSNIERIEITSSPQFPPPELYYRGSDTAVTVVGTAPAPDYFQGGSADERCIGHGGADRYDGGPGNDTIVSSRDSFDTFIFRSGEGVPGGRQGNDRIIGFDESDHIEFYGFADADDLTRTEFNGTTVFTWTLGSVTVDALGLTQGEDYFLVA